jgi:hypothetical protein
MPANVVRDVRAYAVLSGLTISEIVARAITAFLAAVRLTDGRVGIATKSSSITHSTVCSGSSSSKSTSFSFPTKSELSASVPR